MRTPAVPMADNDASAHAIADLLNDDDGRQPLSVAANVKHLDFKPGSFDAVLLVDLLEHLGREDGEDPLMRAESWARIRVVFKSPNGFF